MKENKIVENCTYRAAGYGYGTYYVYRIYNSPVDIGRRVLVILSFAKLHMKTVSRPKAYPGPPHTITFTQHEHILSYNLTNTT